MASPNWGSHWIYRIFAEMASLAFGTFVAAGIARQRAKVAAIIGAVAISAFYLLRNAVWTFVVYFENSGYESIEPWYQHLIEVAIIVGAPFVGLAVSAPALELNGPKTTGFAGINRLHFFWLWTAAALYAGGIIFPLLKLWLYSFVESGNRLSDFMVMVVYGLPLAAFGFPILWGLSTLAGKNAAGWSSTVNNIVGPVIIIVGWPIAVTIQFFWAKLIGWAVG